MTPFLDVAAGIGRRLADDAIWHEGRCSWVGPSDAEDAWGRVTVSYRSLGPDLYGGTAGIAVFLARLHAACGDPAARRTALGAIRHAVHRSGDVTTPVRGGLYAGITGIALSAAVVGTLLHDDALVERAAHLGRHVRVGGDEFDVVLGRAGAVLGLLALGALLSDPGPVALAAGIGDELLELARWRGGACSWRSPSIPTRGHLTGLSHGAAGAAYALLELFRATGDHRFRATADGAFAYERRRFDPEMRNWPDLRGDRSRGPLPFARFWCHGAPGIALSRLGAWQVTRDDARAAEADEALTTTHDAVTAMVSGGRGNYSLCHGLAGNAGVLLHAGEVDGSRWGGLRQKALEVGAAGVAAHARPGGTWPCGTRTGEPPGLMLGLAGIGLFYVRLGAQLRAPDIPTLP